MNSLSIREPVRVAAIFAPGAGITPVWFDWKHRKHTVRSVTFRWSRTRGERILHHFAVTDGEAVFELIYDPAGEKWVLEQVEA